MKHPAHRSVTGTALFQAPPSTVGEILSVAPR